MKAVATIDSSCLIALDRLDLMAQATFLFSRLLVPKAVRKELNHRRQTKDRMERRFNELRFLQRCNDYDQGAVDLLLIERSRTGAQDRGEAEAVVQAAQAGATVIVDDRWGRTLAQRYSLEHHGSLWMLRRFYDLGLINASDLRAHLQRLVDTGFRLPLPDADALLRGIGQAPLNAP
jgi:predicted nucleic acid-binding protein